MNEAGGVCPTDCTRPQKRGIATFTRLPRGGTRDDPAQNRRRDDAMAVGQLVTVRRHRAIKRRIRKSRFQAAVRPSAIVMADPLPKNGAKVAIGHRNREVQKDSTDCADHTLAEGVRL